MNEYVFSLEEVGLEPFSGVLNENIKLLESFFPKLKIVARDNQIKVWGSPQESEKFAQSFNDILVFLKANNTISKTDLEKIFSGQTAIKYKGNDLILHGVSGKPIKVKTPNQKVLVDLAYSNDMVFAVGPAGTGKTYTSVALAVKFLKEKRVKRIILTRPAVEAGENLGFLPGDLKEKLDPYMLPLYDALLDMIPKEKLDYYIEKGIIEIAPLAFMRGRTLNDAFAILDEAQNTTHSQMKMFLTRMGITSKFIITGDPGQIDLPSNKASGLIEAVSIFKEIKGIGLVYLDEVDIIRHPIVSEIIKVYNTKK